MKAIDIEYQSLDLTVFFAETGAAEICAFAGRKGGQDTYTTLTCFTPVAIAQITAKARAALHEHLADEAEEERFVRETCYDTPYA